jgi:1,4-dihydroxy-2-naphthoate octaprenyltransferase
MLAFADASGSATLAGAVLAAGVLLQAGVNLINDHADLARVEFSGEQQRAIRRNARLGAVAIAVACGIGVWLVTLRGWPLLALGLVGVLGLWGYAADPINLKARGLGLPAVFLLTGVLMVTGAYFAVTGGLAADVVAWSVPFSLFAALLLLGNELRDYEADVVDGHRTFTVRHGLAAGEALYRLLVVAIAGSTVLLAVLYEVPAVVLSALCLALLPLRLLGEAPAGRAPLARLTGRGYALYSAAFLALLWMSLS